MLEVVILAAGKGTRMRSPLPKVLHQLAGQPLVSHVLATARALEPKKIHLVVGHGAEQVQSTVAAEDIEFHVQAEQLGTGHAVAQALPACDPNSTVLVLFGDVPLLGAETLAALIARVDTAPVMLAAKLDDPTGYGRVIRDASGAFISVVEQKDAGPHELAVQEVNTGVLAAPAGLMSTLLNRVGNNNAQQEYYLPDVLGLARADGLTVQVAVTADPLEMMGVNDRLQLEALERTLQQRRAEELMREGVAIADRSRIDIRGSLTCGVDVSIDVNTVFEGSVSLGDGVRIGANCVIKNASIADGTDVQPFCHVEDATIGAECKIGPYARLRPGTQLGNTARIGNFVETKNAHFGEGSKANHLAYVGDARIGDGCNIGAGTITCNYDGVNKHRTQLGDGVFIGSNSTLVAPVEIADGGFVAAGSVVTKPVGCDELAVGRARQKNISGWQRPTKNKDSK